MSQEPQEKYTWISAGAELPIQIPRYDCDNQNHPLSSYIEEYARGNRPLNPVAIPTDLLISKEEQIEIELEFLLQEAFRDYKKFILFYLSKRARRRNRHKFDYLAWKKGLSLSELEYLKKQAEEIVSNPPPFLLGMLSLLMRTHNAIDADLGAVNLSD